MTTIRHLVRWLTGRPKPVPPGTGQRIQEREQEAAKRRLLSNQANEYGWTAPPDHPPWDGPTYILMTSPLMTLGQIRRSAGRGIR